MTVANFIPKLWDAQLHTDFRAKSIAAGLTNTKYTGTLAKGSTVQITNLVDIAIKDYKAAGRTTTPDAVATTMQDLVIDQEKNYDFKVDDIDRAQAAGDLGGYTTSANYGLVQDADKFLLAMAVDQAGTDLTSAVFDNEDPLQAWNIFKAARRALNGNNVPLESRWAIVNSEFESAMLTYDSKFTKVDEIGTNQGVRDAALGKILGFNTIVSDNLPGAATDLAQALFVFTPAWHYVSQIDKSEAMRAQDSFADRIRGLHVYGGKVVQPKGVAQFTATAAG